MRRAASTGPRTDRASWPRLQAVSRRQRAACPVGRRVGPTSPPSTPSCWRSAPGYDTQKPEALAGAHHRSRPAIERSIWSSTAFCGLGDDGWSVAERLGRRMDRPSIIGRFAIHTTRKRLLDTPGCRPFDVANLGAVRAPASGSKRPGTGEQLRSLPRHRPRAATSAEAGHRGIAHLHGEQGGPRRSTSAPPTRPSPSQEARRRRWTKRWPTTATEALRRARLGVRHGPARHRSRTRPARRRGRRAATRAESRVRSWSTRCAVRRRRPLPSSWRTSTVDAAHDRSRAVARRAARTSSSPNRGPESRLEAREQIETWLGASSTTGPSTSPTAPETTSDTFHNQWQSYRTRADPGPGNSAATAMSTGSPATTPSWSR